MKNNTFLLRVKTAFIIGCLSVTGILWAQQPDTVSFLHVTDVHLVFNEPFYPKDMIKFGQRFADREVPVSLFSQFLTAVPQQTRSDFVAITGDLVDFYQGESVNGNILDYQVGSFAQYISGFNIPIWLALGNHDLVRLTTPFDWSQHFASQARAEWIRNVPCFRDGTFYSRVYTAGGTTYRLIFLDDAFQSLNEGEKDSDVLPYCSKEQLQWLKDQIGQIPGEVDIVLMHIPFMQEGVPTSDGNPLYTLLGKSPSVKLVLAGHNHCNDIQQIGNARHFTQVRTGAFVMDTQNWRLIRLTRNQILVSYPGRTDTEVTIKE